MKTEERDLLLAVSEGLAKLLEERLVRGGFATAAQEELTPFRRMIEKVRRNADNS